MSIADTLTVLCVRFGLGFLNSDALPTPGSVRESESVAVFAVIEGAIVVVMVGAVVTTGVAVFGATGAVFVLFELVVGAVEVVVLGVVAVVVPVVGLQVGNVAIVCTRVFLVPKVLLCAVIPNKYIVFF